MKMYLIHGKNSNKNSFTLNNFLKVIENIDIQFVEYNSLLSFKEIYDIIDFQLQGISENDIIVGHSLGGYYALIFSSKYNTKKILINPSLHPKGYPELSSEVKAFNRAGLCLTSSEDEVLKNNYEVCKKELKFIQVIDTKEKHRIFDFSKYKKFIDELIGEYLW